MSRIEHGVADRRGAKTALFAGLLVLAVVAVVATGGIVGAQNHTNDSAIFNYTFESCPVADQSGNGNDGTCNGDITSSGTFDGSDDFVEGPELDHTGAFTYVARFETSGATSDFGQSVIGRWSGSQGAGTNTKIQLGGPNNWGTGVMQFQLVTTDGVYDVTGSENLADGDAHTVAGVYDGGQMRLFVDGELVGATDASGDVVDDDSQPIIVGGRSDATVAPQVFTPFNGNITHAAVYEGVPEQYDPSEVPPYEVTGIEAPANVTTSEKAEITATLDVGGDSGGTIPLNLTVDGEVVATQFVTVDGPGETTVTFTQALGDPGERTIGVGDATATVDVTLFRPDIAVASIDAPGEVTPGSTATIAVTLENAGSSDGAYTVTLTVDGGVVEERTVLVEARSSKTLEFTRTFPEAGEHTIAAGNRTATIAVTDDPGGTPTATDPPDGGTPTATDPPDGGTPTATDSGTPTDAPDGDTPDTTDPPGGTPTGTDAPGLPGFGMGVALVALLVVAFVTARRRG